MIILSQILTCFSTHHTDNPPLQIKTNYPEPAAAHTTGNRGISPQTRTDCTLYLYFSGLRAICTNIATYNSGKTKHKSL